MFHVFPAIFEQENLLSKFKFYLKVVKLIFFRYKSKILIVHLNNLILFEFKNY
jgi:hypothetical protein